MEQIYKATFASARIKKVTNQKNLVNIILLLPAFVSNAVAANVTYASDKDKFVSNPSGSASEDNVRVNYRMFSP